MRFESPKERDLTMISRGDCTGLVECFKWRSHTRERERDLMTTVLVEGLVCNYKNQEEIVRVERERELLFNLLKFLIARTKENETVILKERELMLRSSLKSKTKTISKENKILV